MLEAMTNKHPVMVAGQAAIRAGDLLAKALLLEVIEHFLGGCYSQHSSRFVAHPNFHTAIPQRGSCRPLTVDVYASYLPVVTQSPPPPTPPPISDLPVAPPPPFPSLYHPSLPYNDFILDIAALPHFQCTHSLSLIHTHRRVRARAHTHTHMYALSLSLIHTHTLSLSHTHTHTLTHNFFHVNQTYTSSRRPHAGRIFRMRAKTKRRKRGCRVFTIYAQQEHVD